MAFPASEDVISSAERMIGKSFPATMRAHLARSNGGEVSTGDDVWLLFPVRDQSDRARLKRTSNDVVYETAQARRWDGFPENGTAIAANGSGDFLVLLPGSDEVWLWDHETRAVNSIDVDWK